ncbi:ATP-grasp domain-containing protein [Bradyrhizobium sp. 176]|uniref:ATP-grasp domain-containing protein n=1 Tax=unclassified Bradyrhizobium TaxID=2631580 RepID=UPI001FF73948|nr:ATP-grasp domain-containing protein [Bradyrhizobium sp. 176]MCK1557167.1 ATP-grasp domain-containing protein [Bradyrhizobium sp. 171]
MSNSAAIFIESNTTGSGADFILRAQGLGLVPVFVTGSPERYGFLSGISNFELRTCDTSSESEVRAVIDSIATDMRIALLTTSSDFYLYTAALEARRRGLTGPDPNAIALCQNKDRQAAALRMAGIGVPYSATVRAECDISNAIKQIGLPAVAKPISGTGSIGVVFLDTEADATHALRRLLGRTKDVRGRPIQPGALLMSYVAGEEYSVEVLDSNIIGITRKHLGPLPHFVEIGHDIPAAISSSLRVKIENEVLRAVRVLGHVKGPAHVELRVGEDHVTIIEVNPRLAGGSIPTLFRYTTGFDPVLAVLRSLLGMSSPALIGDASGSIRFIVPERDGFFALPPNCEQLVDRFGLTEFVLYQTPPLQFRRCDDFRDRIGHVIAVGDNPAAVVRRAEAAVAFILGA